MGIAVSCAGCGTTFRVSDEAVGMRGRCKKCGRVLRVPAPAAERPHRYHADRAGADESYDVAGDPTTTEPDIPQVAQLASRGWPLPRPRHAPSKAFRRSKRDWLAQALLIPGLVTLGIGMFHQEVYLKALRSTGSVGAGVAAAGIVVAVGVGLLVAGYRQVALGSSKPWNACRRIALVLAALWTTVGVWLVVTQGLRFESGTVNATLPFLVVPTLGLWVVSLTPAPHNVASEGG